MLCCLGGGYAHVVLGSGESKDKALALNGSKVGKQAATELKSAKTTALCLVLAGFVLQLCGKRP